MVGWWKTSPICSHVDMPVSKVSTVRFRPRMVYANEQRGCSYSFRELSDWLTGHRWSLWNVGPIVMAGLGLVLEWRYVNRHAGATKASGCGGQLMDSWKCGTVKFNQLPKERTCEGPVCWPFSLPLSHSEPCSLIPRLEQDVLSPVMFIGTSSRKLYRENARPTNVRDSAGGSKAAEKTKVTQHQDWVCWYLPIHPAGQPLPA